MSRGSFGRTVARAAASGGSRNYRARPPVLWYVVMLVIVLGGLGLIAYSRNERLHPKTTAAQIPPTKSDNWHAAFALDICGRVQPNLPQNSNLATAGIRTFGDGVIDIDPGAVANPSKFTGTNATLGTFVSTYGNHFSISSTGLHLPGKTAKAYHTGETCPASSPMAGKKAEIVVAVWSSPTAKATPYQGDPAALALRNGQMITVGFVPKGTSLPVPPSRQTLVQDLGTAGAKK